MLPAPVSVLWSQISEEMRMTRILVLAAALGLGLSAASACEFQRSAKIDQTVVASIIASETQSTPAIQVPAKQREPESAAPVDSAE
jgi:hypothetical protein